MSKIKSQGKIISKILRNLKIVFHEAFFFTKEQNSAEKQPSSKHIFQYRKTVIKKDVFGKIS